jgi:NADPH2 dehydrogenase
MHSLFTPIKIGSVTIKNRLVMAPMQQRSGTPEGLSTDHHVIHYARRAEGGVGLVIIESTAVSVEGRLFSNDIGIYSDDQIEPMKRVVKAIHHHGTPVFIQLAHGGRKSDPESGRALLAPSAIAFDEEYGMPTEMTLEDIQRIRKDFVKAAARSVQAGMDGIELHAAHGYLLHQFLSPLSNRRQDEYGGSLENRVRLIKEILVDIRKELGSELPVIVRVSASDYVDGGLQPQEVAQAMNHLLPLGLDAVHVSSGGLLPQGPSKVYPGYQVGYAEEIKKALDIPVIAVGWIHEAELANTIISEGKADLIAIGRPLLEDPDFVQQWRESKV